MSCSAPRCCSKTCRSGVYTCDCGHAYYGGIGVRHIGYLPTPYRGVRMDWHGEFFRHFFFGHSHSCTRLARRSAPQNSTNPFDSFGIATAPLSTFSKHPVFPEILIFGRSRPSDPFSLHLRLTLGFFHSGILSTLSGDCVLCIEFLQYWCVAFHNEIMGHVFFLSSSSVASSCVHGVGVK